MPIGERTLIMGILNVTPDSFSDGGLFASVDGAVAHAEGLISEGADIIDIGGESTRPGGEPVSAEEEISRVVPVIEGLARRVSVPLSVDTTKSEVARAALDAGAAIVNDISALRFDFYVADVAARAGAGGGDSDRPQLKEPATKPVQKPLLPPITGGNPAPA